MKKFKKSLICACTVAIGMSGSQVFAQTTLGSNLVLKEVVAVVPEVLSKEAFMQKVNERVTLKVIHAESLNYKDWVKTDLAYLSEAIDKNKIASKLLNTEIAELHKALTVFKAYDKVELRGALIEPYHVTAIKDALMYAIEVRENMLVKLDKKQENLRDAVYEDTQLAIGHTEFDIYDKTVNSNPLSSANSVLGTRDLIGILINMADYDRVSDVPLYDLDMVSGVLYDVITNEKTPDNLVKNLKIYVSPYRFFGYMGFTTSSNFLGREEEVFIGLSTEKVTYYSILDTVLHELGHVYQADFLGASSGPKRTEVELVQAYSKWSNIEEILECKELTDCVTSEDKFHYLSESIAEHFRLVMYKYLGFDIKSGEGEVYPYVKELGELILADLPKYENVATYNAIPNLYINGDSLDSYAYNSKRYESFNRNSDGTVNLLFNGYTENEKAPLKYDLYVRVGDDAKRLVRNKDITNDFLDSLKLDKGEYALTIHSDDVLYRHMDFHIN